MTNISEITGFSKDLPLRDAMNMILISRIEDIFHNSESIFNEEDTECLHKMRVASRRLKGYLKIFSELFPKQKFNRIYNLLRNFIRLIGEIRELDVSFEIIDNYLSKNTPEDNKILVLFISKLKSQKSTLRENLETDKRLIKFVKSKTDLTGLVQEGFAKKQKKRFINFNLDISFIDNPVLIIPELRKRVLRDMKVVLNHPTKKSELHQLRIKAKPLRYSMELYSGFINNEFDEMISEAKKFVERAGTIHDIDVLIPRLIDFAKEIKIYNNRIKKNKDKISVIPLNLFVKSLREKRRKQFDLFCNTLEKWNKEDIESKLKTYTEPFDNLPAEINPGLQQS